MRLEGGVWVVIIIFRVGVAVVGGGAVCLVGAGCADGEVFDAACLVVGYGAAVGVILYGEMCYWVVHLGVEDVALVEAVLLEAFLELCGGDVLALLGVRLEVAFLEVLAGYLGVEAVPVGVVLVSPEDEAFGDLLPEPSLFYAA